MDSSSLQKDVCHLPDDDLSLVLSMVQKVCHLESVACKCFIYIADSVL